MKNSKKYYLIDAFDVMMILVIALRMLLMCLYGTDWDSFTIITLCIFLIAANSKIKTYEKI